MRRRRDKRPLTDGSPSSVAVWRQRNKQYVRLLRTLKIQVAELNALMESRPPSLKERLFLKISYDHSKRVVTLLERNRTTVQGFFGPPPGNELLLDPITKRSKPTGKRASTKKT